MTYNLNPKDIEVVAERIKTEFFHKINVSRINVFLCGSSMTDSQSLRVKLAQYIRKKEWYSFNLTFPEDIFDELLYGSSRNLHTLEVLLADSVDVVVIVVESPGAIAELGAFTHDINLRSKVMCVVYEKYKKDKSFINLGPIRLVKTISKDNVVYVNHLDDHEIERSFNKIIKHIRKRYSALRRSVMHKVSLLQLENYLLSTIFLLEPVSKDLINKLVKVVTNEELDYTLATDAALSILLKKKLIKKQVDNSYVVTSEGYEVYMELLYPNSRQKDPLKRKKTDDFRLEILNWQLRNKKLNL